MAAQYIGTLLMAPGISITNTPPWGAASSMCIRPTRAPVMADPIMQAGMTRSGSRATKGMAPSVMKARPSTAAALEASRSSLLKRFRKIQQATAMPSGGTMPAAMTAAIGILMLLASSVVPKT